MKRERGGGREGKSTAVWYIKRPALQKNNSLIRIMDMKSLWRYLIRFYTSIRPNDSDYIKKLYPDKVQHLYRTSKNPCYNVLIVNKYDPKYQEKHTFIAVIYLHDIRYYSLANDVNKFGNRLDCILDKKHQVKRTLSNKMFKFDKFKNKFKTDLTMMLSPLVLNVETIDNLNIFLMKRQKIILTLSN